MNRASGGADLHLHTVYSDGADTPENLVEKAIGVELQAIAVTDHDIADGVEPTIRAARGRIEVVPGVEFSVESGESEMHIIGLFLRHDDPALRAKLDEFRRRRKRRIFEITDRLKRVGVNISPEDVFRRAGDGSPGRVHVAEALVENNYAKNIGAAFARLIGSGGPAYVNKIRPAPAETLEIIRQAGGVSVLAHPGLSQRDDMIPELVDAGLRAIEAISTSHSPSERERYIKLAEDYGLLVSAGSDSHGAKRERDLIGLARLSEDRLEALRAASGR